MILPCIWPTVKSVSNLSIPASSNILGGILAKNLEDNPLNQPHQNFSVFDKSILQVYLLLCQKTSIK